jgi:hypothetical protein
MDKEIILKNIQVSEDGCWLWLGRKQPNGYGIYKSKYSHRFSYEIFKGEIPKGLVVMHSCDNRICCNPDHLSVGTYRDNIMDAVKKGRQRNQNSGKVFCKNGHRLEGANLKIEGTFRRCVTCQKKYQKEWGKTRERK